jgi:hypothetical protein
MYTCQHYKFLNITCTLVATDVILRSSECMSKGDVDLFVMALVVD